MSPINAKKIIFHFFQFALLSVGLWLTVTQVFAQQPVPWNELSDLVQTEIKPGGLQSLGFELLDNNTNLEELRAKLVQLPAACVAIKKSWAEGIAEALAGKSPSKSLEELSSKKPCSQYRTNPSTAVNPMQTQLACCLTAHAQVSDQFALITRELPSDDSQKEIADCKADSRAGADYANYVCDVKDPANLDSPKDYLSLTADDQTDFLSKCPIPVSPRAKTFAACFMSGFTQNAKQNLNCKQVLVSSGLIDTPQGSVVAPGNVSTASEAPSSFKNNSQDNQGLGGPSPSNGSVGK